MLCVDSLWHLNQSQEAAGAHTLVSPVAVSPRADLRETQELKSQVLCMRLKYVGILARLFLRSFSAGEMGAFHSTCPLLLYFVFALLLYFRFGVATSQSSSARVFGL